MPRSKRPAMGYSMFLMLLVSVASVLLSCEVVVVVSAITPECLASKNEKEGNDPHPLQPPRIKYDHFKGWTCDDLTPSLCDLPQPPEKTVFRIKGLDVAYWRYKPPPEIVQGHKDSLYTQGKDMYPVIVIHGGPAQSHNYMLPLKQQACRGREVIFYDQVGCGRSDWPAFDDDMRTNNARITNDFPWILDPAYYALELKLLIEHWGLTKYHIVAHSWGTIVAQLFALDSDPGDALLSLVLNGPFTDTKVYNDAQMDPETGTIRRLPPFIRNRIHELEAVDGHEMEEYQAIDGFYSVMFTSLTVGTHVVPDCVQRTYDLTNWVIYDKLWGPSEVRIIPAAILDGFSITHRLKDIEYPVLVTTAEFDLITVRVLEPILENLPYYEHIEFGGSAHATTIDVPGPLNDAVAEFFERMERLGRLGLKRRSSRKIY